MKLIRESFDIESKVLEEAVGGKKNYYIEGIFMQTECTNRNGRMYRRPVMEKEVGRYTKIIESKRALGELGHPETPSINLDKVSHLIESLRWEGNDIIGRAKILDTPNGKIAQNFIDAGVSFGVSSRGMGSLKSVGGINEVQDDFHLATVDIVADPSAPDAFVRGIMENKEWVMVNGIWMEQQIDQAKSAINKASQKDIEKVSLQIFEAFLRRLG
jgi:hypothetical protein